MLRTALPVKLLPGDSAARLTKAFLVSFVVGLLCAGCGGAGGSAPAQPASPPAAQPPPSAPAPSLTGPYRITDLSAAWAAAGPPDDTPCTGRPIGPFATDLNDYGEVAAYYVSGQAGEQCAVIWTGSDWAEPGPASSLLWYPTALTNSRRVSGYALDPDTKVFSAAIWSNGTSIRISSTLSSAVDVNDSGQAVVQFSDSAEASFFWDGTTLRSIGSLGGGFSRGRAINGLGVVVGSSTTGSNETHAFLWDGRTMADLGTLGSDYSVALDVNDALQVVGSSREQSIPTAFIWEAGSIRSLGLPAGASPNLSSLARSINEWGQVVGAYNVPVRPNQDLSEMGGRAILWAQGTAYDLNDLLDPSDRLVGNIELHSALAVNEARQVLALGRTLEPNRLAYFLLTPTR